MRLSVDCRQFNVDAKLLASVPPREVFRPLGMGMAALLITLMPLHGADAEQLSQVPDRSGETTASASTGAAPGGLITIESDSQSADNLTGVVTAAGNVRIVYPSRGMVATARQAQYFSREGRLVLSGDVDVTQDGGNALRAERVVYLLEEERAEAEPTPGQQVFTQMVIRSDSTLQTPLTP